MRGTIFSSGFIGRLVIVALSATLAATLAVAAFTSTGAAQATKTANLEEGFEKVQAIRAFPNEGVPLLKSFIFQYVPSYAKCVPVVTDDCFGQVDHHIWYINIGPNTLAPGKIHLVFSDEGRSPFYYYVQHYILTDPSIRKFETGFNEAVGQTTKTISRPTPASNYVFVLRGFSLSFADAADRHIDEVGIIENDGKVTVEFNDALHNRRFKYKIWYAYVPREMFTTSGLGERSGTYAKDHAQQAIPDGPAVIRGFRFEDKPTCVGSRSCSDHHIKKIGVENQGGRVQVRYADKNGDDPFDWRVKWGILKRSFPLPR